MQEISPIEPARSDTPPPINQTAGPPVMPTGLMGSPQMIATLATICTVTLSLVVYLYLASLEGSPRGFAAIDQLGSFLSGVFGFIGVIWICATFAVQMKEMRNQQADLDLQRAANSMTETNFRAQLLLTIHDHALDGLSSTLKQTHRLVSDEMGGATSIDINADAASFLAATANSREFHRLISTALEQDNSTIRVLVTQFCDDCDALKRLFSESGVPTELHKYLFELKPISYLSSDFRSLLNETTADQRN